MQSNTEASIKIIPPTAHGVFDYLAVVVFAILPSLVEPIIGWFAIFFYLLAGAHLALTLATRFSAGMFDGISFRIHGLIELLVAILLVVCPWIVGFNDLTVVRNTFVISGMALFVVWLLTDYRRVTTGNQATQNGDNTDPSAPSKSEGKPANQDE